ncbi:hypothetical protein Z950_67 [Sulfitobacter mediterraneus KCTC 32188]|jgi:hypothetical protein|nr:hypothetical protein Z950_67 [Sulfitobacter mediterraneus KCTC 32188]
MARPFQSLERLIIGWGGKCKTLSGAGGFFLAPGRRLAAQSGGA